MNLSVRRTFLGLLLCGLAGLFVLALLPEPLAVETGRVTRGTMQVTVDEEGRTRAHDRFVVAAPVSGRLARIELHEGDALEREQVVARLHLAPLDPQQRAEVLARVQAAQATQHEADKGVERARANHAQLRRERERVERLAADGLVPQQTLEAARVAEVTAAKELDASRFRMQAAASETAVAEAGLLALETGGAVSLVELRSPVHGRVLRVLERSERVVAAGTPLLELGDPQKLEVVVDVLSADAVRIEPGASMLLEGWGGEQPLRARVRTVEPSAFTKVSALGVEEQRVNLVADLLDPPGVLGDGYRVEARIVVWEAADVLRVPASAVFRHGESWAAYAVEQGRTRLCPLRIGQRDAQHVEVLAGLDEGATVVVYPSNQLADGARVTSR